MRKKPQTSRSSLRQLIQSRGLSQARLSERLGVDPSYLSHIMGGRKQPSLRRALAISRELGCSLDVLTQALERR